MLSVIVLKLSKLSTIMTVLEVDILDILSSSVLSTLPPPAKFKANLDDFIRQ